MAVGSAKKGKKPAGVKGRPSVKREETKQLELITKYGGEYRSIEIWNHKLENMLTIL